jgi:TetR/AcrR family acrAB operon transcriptional repressor
MVRKTKAETEETRRQILDAARRIFAERGVSRTTLEQIAEAAGVTRGAIYWHFSNKAELFIALRDDIAMPLLDRIANLFGDDDASKDPLVAIEDFLHLHVERVITDRATRETFEIMIFKCEYTGEFGETLKKLACKAHSIEERLVKAYAAAQARGLLRPGADPVALARDTYAFLFGIIRLTVGPSELSSPYTAVPEMIRDHIALRRR